jgi:outer membrane protein OmpA-like peptidoglycan-associated protein
MPAAHRRRLRAASSAALLAAGILLAVSLDHGTSQDGATEYSATLFTAQQFSVWLGRDQLTLTGVTTSEQHEAALRQLVREQFPGAEATTDFKPAVILAPNWESLSTRLLYLVAATDSAEATLDANGIVLRAVSSDPTTYQSRLKFLQSALPDDSTVKADVLVIDNIATLDELCTRNFAILAAQPVNFSQSSTSIRQSSYALLDRLIEFAFDCRRTQIVIAGHSDATGHEAWNLQVSRARAQAVAAHLEQNGVRRERLLVEGHGSSQPVASNDTVNGREQNRRIELKLR